MNGYQIYEGLKILAGSDKKESLLKIDMDAQHDILYAGPQLSELSEDEFNRLEKELGWHWDEENDCWAHF